MHKWWVLIVKHARRSILAVALNKVVIPVVVHLNWEMDCFFLSAIKIVDPILVEFNWHVNCYVNCGGSVLNAFTSKVST